MKLPEDDLLSAFDRVANSNSHLLKAPPGAGDLRQRFCDFVASRAFTRSLCESDRVRNWHNYQWIPPEADFYAGAGIEFARTPDFGGMLCELLKRGPCFYGKRYPPVEVQQIVTGFLEVLRPDEGEVLSVGPDFLNGGLTFFDGCGCDHCWTWLSGGDLWVLLLNGSP